MPTTQADIDWVKSNLPEGAEADLNRNGIQKSLDQRVRDLMTDHDDDRNLVIADLYDQLDANIPFESRSLMNKSESKPRFKEQAEYYRNRSVKDESGEPGTFQDVPIADSDSCIGDEFSG